MDTTVWISPLHTPNLKPAPQTAQSSHASQCSLGWGVLGTWTARCTTFASTLLGWYQDHVHETFVMMTLPPEGKELAPWTLPPETGGLIHLSYTDALRQQASKQARAPEKPGVYLQDIFSLPISSTSKHLAAIYESIYAQLEKELGKHRQEPGAGLTQGLR